MYMCCGVLTLMRGSSNVGTYIYADTYTHTKTHTHAHTHTHTHTRAHSQARTHIHIYVYLLRSFDSDEGLFKRCFVPSIQMV